MEAQVNLAKLEIQARLEQLRAEQAEGEQMSMKKERQLSQLNRNLLRISGAIQILEEILKAIEEVTDGSD